MAATGTRRAPLKRAKGLARLLPPAPDPGQGAGALGLPYEGLQHPFDPEAARRAHVLLARGYGALEPWLSSKQEPLTLQQVVAAAARGADSKALAEQWRQQQQAQRPRKRTRQRAVDRIDWE